MKGVVVAGIGTEVGKTVAAAVLVEALDADYWKPVQSGELDNSDTRRVQELAGAPGRHFHPEAYRLNHPLSPHAAARLDGVHIDAGALDLPRTQRPLVVELAGGLLVPLNDKLLNVDLVERWGLPVVLVCSYYLGSINHTLLSIECLRRRGIPLQGLILNGEPNPDSRAAILRFGAAPCLLELPWQADLGAHHIRAIARGVKL